MNILSFLKNMVSDIKRFNQKIFDIVEDISFDIELYFSNIVNFFNTNSETILITCVIITIRIELKSSSILFIKAIIKDINTIKAIDKSKLKILLPYFLIEDI